MNINRTPKTETPPRPYEDKNINELFEEILQCATDAQAILDFAFAIYKDADANIKVCNVMAYLDSVRERIATVTDGLPPMINELKQREKDW